MTDIKENPFVSFYSKYKISPVHQDISTLKNHLKRREKLYRLLGLPPVTFSNRKILEVGPGGGYNALAYFHWGATVDFVEPNPKAQEELPVLLGAHGIPPDSWSLFPGKVENLPTGNVYSIVIAEGFLPGLFNIPEVVSRLGALLEPGGIIVVTCVDDISYFFEHVRRLIANKLIHSIDRFEDRVSVLVSAFGSHLKTLKNASRPVEDWVTDQFLNPAIYADWFSIEECINEFGPEFEFLGSSPAMLTDYSWYKDLQHNTRENLIEQFRQKRHTFLLWDLPESMRPAEENEKLFQAVYLLRRYAGETEKIWNREKEIYLANRLWEIRDLARGIDSRIPEAIQEAINLLLDERLTPEKVSDASKLAVVFGRGQQYVSMVKKYTQ